MITVATINVTYIVKIHTSCICTICSCSVTMSSYSKLMTNKALVSVCTSDIGLPCRVELLVKWLARHKPKCHSTWTCCWWKTAVTCYVHVWSCWQQPQHYVPVAEAREVECCMMNTRRQPSAEHLPLNSVITHTHTHTHTRTHTTLLLVHCCR